MLTWWKLCMGMGCALLAWLSSAAARADFVLQFADATGALVSQYPTIEVGQSVDVSVYLLQTSGTLLTDEGIFSATFRIDYRDATVARALTASDVQPAGVFDFDNQITLDNTGVSLDLSSLSMNFGSPADVNRMLLATVRLTGVAEGTMRLGFSDLNTTTDGFLAGNGDAFDNTVNFSSIASLKVIATPEPSSILMLMTGASLVAPRLLNRWRRGGNHLILQSSISGADARKTT